MIITITSCLDFLDGWLSSWSIESQYPFNPTHATLDQPERDLCKQPIVVKIFQAIHSFFLFFCFSVFLVFCFLLEMFESLEQSLRSPVSTLPFIVA